MWVWSLGWEDPLEKEMTTHSRILAWKIPWTEEPGRLQSKGLQRQTQLSNWAQGQSLVTAESESIGHPVIADSARPNGRSPPGSSVLEILQEFLEWVVIPFTWGSSLSKDQTLVSCIAGRFFAIWACREAPIVTVRELSVEILEFNWLESSDSSLTWSCVTLSKLFKFSVPQLAYP